ncbi:MAG: O-antigen/teichoic acid export membrane protein [Saprospiraceae bacterium]|jgi:O-antigen/teichoic acid export membrane protein
MRREFILNILFLVMINLIIKPFYTFFIETDVQNLLGPASYGVYFSLFNLSYILQIVLDMGIHNYGSQYLAKGETDSNRFLSLALTTKGILMLLFAFTIVFVSFALSYDPQLRNLLYFISLNQVFISLIFFFRSSLAAIGYYRMNSIVSVLDKLLMIIGFIYVLHISSEWRANFDVMGFIGIRMMSYALTAIIAFLLIYIVGKRKLHCYFNKEEVWHLMRKSLPFAVIVIFMGLSNRTDAVMLERMLADNGLQSGIYAAAYRIFYSLNTIGFLFSMLLLPMFATLLIKDRRELHNLIDLSLKSILLLSVGAVAIVYILRYPIMDTLYKNDASLYGTDILMTLCFTFILSSIVYILGTLLTANAQLKYLNILFVLSTAVNIIINALLIPKYGAHGAAIATLTTHSVVVLGQIALCYWIVPLRMRWENIFCIIGFICSIGIITFYSDTLFQPILLRCFIVVLSILLLSIVLKMIDLKLVYRLLTNPTEVQE